MGESLARNVSVLPVVYVPTQTEIGKSLGMSQRKVSRTIASATGVLRGFFGAGRQ